jgi:hypothetical protein
MAREAYRAERRKLAEMVIAHEPCEACAKKEES